MNFEELAAGSSCKGQENGDESNGSERPLKKARFAWQVKGKYHLKNDRNDPAKTSSTESTAPEASESSDSGCNASSSNNLCTEPAGIKTMRINNSFLSQDLNTFDSVIPDREKSNSKPKLTDELKYTGLLCSKCIKTNDEAVSYSINNPLDSVPVSMVALENYTEEQCIARWQARQMEKGSLDNSINNILDHIQQSPFSITATTVQAYAIADFINNLPGVNSVENEGILMAISAHGLQNTSSSSSFNSSHSLDFDEFCEPIDEEIPPPVGISLSPCNSDEESHEQSQPEFELTMNNLDWSYPDDLKTEDKDSIPSPTYHDTSSLSFQYLSDTLHNADVATAAANGVASGNDHDFLDTAVLFAIQSKGLTTFGVDYG